MSIRKKHPACRSSSVKNTINRMIWTSTQLFNHLIKTMNRTCATPPCASRPLIKSSAQARASGATCPPLQSKFVNRRVLNDELVMKIDQDRLRRSHKNIDDPMK